MVKAVIPLQRLSFTYASSETLSSDLIGWQISLISDTVGQSYGDGVCVKTLSCALQSLYGTSDSFCLISYHIINKYLHPFARKKKQHSVSLHYDAAITCLSMYMWPSCDQLDHVFNVHVTIMWPTYVNHATYICQSWDLPFLMGEVT